MKDLIRPAPLPSEFELSYAGRFLRLNRFESTVAAKSAIRARFGCSIPFTGRHQWPTLLGYVSGMDVGSFTRHHTLLNLRGAIVPGATSARTRGTNPKWQLRSGGYERKHAYFCSHCVDEDLAFHGISYWRVHHQIPGAYWCDRHDTPLREAAFSALYTPPSMALSSSSPVSGPWVDHARGNRAITRYIEIAQGLALRDHLMYQGHAVECMRAAADTRGLKYSVGQPHGQHVEEFVKAAYPASWLDHAFPKSLHPHGLRVLRLVQPTVAWRSGSTWVWPYVITLSALFDSAEAALSAFTNKGAEARPKTARMAVEAVRLART